MLYGIALVALGVALAPALWLWSLAWQAPVAGPARWLFLGGAAAVALFVAGCVWMGVVALLNALLPTRPWPYRGTYYTLAAVPWFLHNGLFYLVRYTVLPFICFTVFEIWFLRAMGMRIGRGTVINTELLSDPCLITLGENVAVGGSVRIIAHYAGHGHLVIEPVVIGNRVTLGICSTVMAGVVMGDGATLLPHSVLLPGSRVGAGELWGGVPARRMPEAEMAAIKRQIRGSFE